MLNRKWILFYFLVTLTLCVFSQAKTIDSSLYLVKTISGKISPKSVVHNGNGVFYAQNMMYRHTVTVYNRSFDLVKTIKDQVNLKDFGFNLYTSSVKGGPVECDFSHNGKYAWVSNYNMTGGGDEFFNNPGCDNCSSSSKYDSSFVYQIDVASHKIVNVIKVGAVPKYIACTPDSKKVVVTNWTSGDVSIIDVDLKKEVKRVKIGTFPRGIVIDSKSEFAYITVMGSTKIAKLNLKDYSYTFLEDVGKGPRHICISPDDKWLYLTLNNENKVAKINTSTFEIQKVSVGHQPRSMTISKDGKYLYIVNYNDATFTKLSTSSLETLAISETKSKPIGITFDGHTNQVWVACYSGHIQVFKDSIIKSKKTFEIGGGKEKSVLALSSEGSHVANLSDKKDSTIAIQDSLVDQAIVSKKNPKVFRPIKQLFFAKSKDVDLSKFQKKEPVMTEEVVAVKEKPIHQSLSLDKNKPCLVIVGGFAEDGNAEKKMAKLKKMDIESDTFYNSAKNLHYVYVYSCDNKEQAAQWLVTFPKEISNWIMVK